MKHIFFFKFIIVWFAMPFSLRLNTELRTQTFIYLTNNVYNYIQIGKKIFNKPGRETTLRQKGLPLMQ